MSGLHPNRDQMSLDRVLAALGHPIRLEIVRALAAQGETYCGAVDTGAPPSTMTGHWRTLRESGVIHQRAEGRRHYMTLRHADLEALWPGLLQTVLGDTTTGGVPDGPPRPNAFEAAKDAPRNRNRN